MPSVWDTPHGKDVLALVMEGKLTHDQAAEAMHTSRRSLTQYLAWRDPERRKKHSYLTAQGKAVGAKKNGVGRHMDLKKVEGLVERLSTQLREERKALAKERERANKAEAAMASIERRLSQVVHAKAS